MLRYKDQQQNYPSTKAKDNKIKCMNAHVNKLIKLIKIHFLKIIIPF